MVNFETIIESENEHRQEVIRCVKSLVTFSYLLQEILFIYDVRIPISSLCRVYMKSEKKEEEGRQANKRCYSRSREDSHPSYPSLKEDRESFAQEVGEAAMSVTSDLMSKPPTFLRYLKRNATNNDADITTHCIFVVHGRLNICLSAMSPLMKMVHFLADAASLTNCEISVTTDSDIVLHTHGNRLVLDVLMTNMCHTYIVFGDISAKAYESSINPLFILSDADAWAKQKLSSILHWQKESISSAFAEGEMIDRVLSRTGTAKKIEPNKNTRVSFHHSNVWDCMKELKFLALQRGVHVGSILEQDKNVTVGSLALPPSI
jgi:hypothetical protein